MSPLSLGDAAVAGAGVLLCAYELWLFARRPGHREHLWMAVIGAMAATYAALMAVHYNVGHDAALILTRFEGAALTTASCAGIAWILLVTGRATPRAHALLGAFWLAVTALTLSPWVVRSMRPVEPWLGDGIFWRRVQTPAVGALQATGIALLLLGLWLSTRAPPERRSEARHYQLGIGLWAADALHVTVTNVLGRPLPLSTVEYGFLAFAVALVSHDARHYMQALATSEHTVRSAISRQRELEALHHDVVASIGEGVVLLDSLQRVRLWNPVAAALTGVPETEAVGRSLWDLIQVAPADERTLAAALAEATRGRVVTTVPAGLRSGQREVQVAWTLTPFGPPGDRRGAIAILHDATAEQAAQLALIRSERNSKALIESLPDAIAVLSDERILYINAALARLLGLGPDDSLSGLSAGRLVHHADRARLRQIRDGSDPAELRLNARNRGITAEIRCVPIEFDGAPAQALIARDVTERNELTARMMELDRMVAVGTLAAGVGHEINNPLAYMVANLEELRKEIAAAEPRLLLEETLQGASRIRDIVQALAGFSRAGVERTTVSVGDALHSAITMSGNEIRHRARVSLDHQGDFYVVAGEAELAQVFLNLLVNASQALPNGTAETNEIRVRTYADPVANRVVCEVADTGSGIAPEILPRIFDPFFTTKPVGEGTGLGLSICRQTIRALGGDIEVETEVGVGTTFRVLLPPAEAVTEPLRLSRRARSTPAPDGRLRVMLVDDEASLLRALSRPLRRHFDLSLCVSAVEALEHLERGDDFDAIVTDLMMPGTSGMELYDQIRERFPKLAERVLFTTGGAFTPEARAFSAQMADRVLPKPVAISELRRRVREIAATHPGRARTGSACA